MCSIAGFVASKALSQDEMHDLCHALLFYGQTRGKQSVGIWTNHDGGMLHKRATDLRGILKDEAFHKVIQPASMALLHTRQPTSGGREDEHAQPFHRGRTVTIHNGMVHNDTRLAELFKVDMPSGVDSEIFTAVISKMGIKASLGLMKAASGSSSIAAYHKGRMYVLRDGNPLEYITLGWPDGRTVTVFASTREILFAALRTTWLVPLDVTSDFLPMRTLCEVKADGLTEIGSFDFFPTKNDKRDIWEEGHYGYGYGLASVAGEGPRSQFDKRTGYCIDVPKGKLQRYNYKRGCWELIDDPVTDYGKNFPDTDREHKRNESPTLPGASNGHGEAAPQSNDEAQQSTQMPETAGE